VSSSPTTFVPPTPVIRLVHTWPSPARLAGEMSRRLNLVHTAVARGGDKGASKEAASKEWRAYCAKVGRKPTKPLPYAMMDKAWRGMDGKEYDGLTFRYAVVGREAGGSSNEVLHDARNADAEEMLCFLRTLDADCDGKVSEADFCQVVLGGTEAALASVRDMDERWQAAALALETAGPRK